MWLVVCPKQIDRLQLSSKLFFGTQLSSNLLIQVITIFRRIADHQVYVAGCQIKVPCHTSTILSTCYSWEQTENDPYNDLSTTWFVQTPWPNSSQNLILWILFFRCKDRNILFHISLPRSFVRSKDPQIEI